MHAAFGPDVLLEIDGGVTTKNIAQIREAGAEVIVAGTAVFHAADYRKVIQTLKGT